MTEESDFVDAAKVNLVRSIITRYSGLCTKADLARRWDLTPQRVGQLAEKDGFPAPVGKLGKDNQPVWLAKQADEWRKAATTKYP